MCIGNNTAGSYFFISKIGFVLYMTLTFLQIMLRFSIPNNNMFGVTSVVLHTYIETFFLMKYTNVVENFYHQLS